MGLCWRKFKALRKQLLWIVLCLQVTLLLWHTLQSQNEVDSDEPETEELEDLVNLDSEWKYKGFDPRKWNVSDLNTLALKNAQSADVYFREITSGVKCFIFGTDFERSLQTTKCECLERYFGKDCGIPEAAWFSHFAKNPRDRKLLKVRDNVRRIIHALPVNHEFDFFEARVNSLKDVVDAFIVQESNYSTYGAAKDLLFMERFKEGWLAPFQNKIVWVLLSHFMDEGSENGWYADAYMRMHLSKKGMRLVKNKREDDLFLLLDADELPTPEVLLFLKLYDGYSEPIRFGFKWTVFGFYWLKTEEKSLIDTLPFGSLLSNANNEKLLQLWVMSTVGMMARVYGNNGFHLRQNDWKHELLKGRLQNYTARGNRVKDWDLGSIGHYAGYHCSWCYNPEGVRTKLESAQKNDNPRWGDYPEKTDLTYITRLIKTGGWFDDTHPFIRVNDKSKKFYAPQYILDNPAKYSYLLEPP